MSEKGILFVLTGPSGVGKGTVLKEVRAHKPLFYSISATTRAPRARRAGRRALSFYDP